MAREQRLLGEDVAQFLSRLESQPVPPAAAMGLTMQQLVDTTFPVRRSVKLQSMQSFAGAAASSCNIWLHTRRKALLSPAPH